MTEYTKAVIEILKNMLNMDSCSNDYLAEMIDKIDIIKNNINCLDDDELIDKFDEIQDYFEYLLISDNPLDINEIKHEILEMINDLIY